MVDIGVEGRRLHLGDQTKEFDAPITEYVKFDGFVVVRLKATGEAYSHYLRNVIAVDHDGTVR